jgi:hypothetical protein
VKFDGSWTSTGKDEGAQRRKAVLRLIHPPLHLFDAGLRKKGEFGAAATLLRRGGGKVCPNDKEVVLQRG